MRVKDVGFGAVAVLLAVFWLVAAVRFAPAVVGGRQVRAPRPSGAVDVPRVAGRIAIAVEGVIYVVRDGRSTPVANGGADRDPALSPDGSRLAYSAGATIDGKQVFEGQTVPAHLSYASVVVRSVEGGTPDVLVNGLQRKDANGFDVVEFETQPAWSPDGAELAFISDGGAGADLQVMTLATKRIRTLSSGSILADPAWSPDGRTIALTSYTTGTPSVLLVPAAGGANGKKLAVRREGDAYRASWSADGRWLVLTLRTERGDDVVAVEVASGRVVDVTTDGHSWGGIFSPDGTAVAFLREHDAQIDLFVEDLGDLLSGGTAKEPERVTSGGGVDGASRISWSR